METVNTVISRNDLRYSYDWIALPHGDPRLTGDPDAVAFCRHHGHEMLAFLNRICSSIEQALLAERLINSQAPRQLKTRAQVLKWLQENWPLVPD